MYKVVDKYIIENEILPHCESHRKSGRLSFQLSVFVPFVGSNSFYGQYFGVKRVSKHTW